MPCAPAFKHMHNCGCGGLLCQEGVFWSHMEGDGEGEQKREQKIEKGAREREREIETEGVLLYLYDMSVRVDVGVVSRIRKHTETHRVYPNLLGPF
jgi:hypothetical protein